tara:strand:+ start:288 stop:467 length:180 start_codon:yes stop_codon:yes gene_type:complete
MFGEKKTTKNIQTIKIRTKDKVNTKKSLRSVLGILVFYNIERKTNNTKNIFLKFFLTFI